MNVNINEIRTAIREAVLEWMILEFESKEMPNGTTWKHNKGWASKNKNGVLNYWTTPDSKDKAEQFSKDSTRKQPDGAKNASK